MRHGESPDLGELSAEDTRLEELAAEWREGDYEKINENPDLRSELNSIIDQKYAGFTRQYPESIDSLESFIKKTKEFHSYFQRKMGRTSATDYEVGYLFTLEAMGEMDMGIPQAERAYIANFLATSRLFYNNPDQSDKELMTKRINEFPGEDIEGSLEKVLAHLQTLLKADPGHYYELTHETEGDGYYWETEEYIEWQKSLDPALLPSENGNDMIRNNVYWVQRYLYTMLQAINPSVSGSELQTKIDQVVLANLEKVFGEKI